ncbi:MAG: IS110 family transposase [Bacteroidota bacterium]
MKSKLLLCGIDVSKETLDIYSNNKLGRVIHFKVKNNKDGHKELIKRLGIDRTYIMESTGVYSLAICLRLHKAGADLRVENSLKIKRYIQMNMERHKNDKSDAKWIFKYGQEHESKIWHLPSKAQFYCMQVLRAIELYKRSTTMFKNFSGSQKIHPFCYSVVKKSIASSQKKIEKEVAKLEKLVDSLITCWCGELKRNLLTIPSLGIRAVSYLIIYTDGFTKIQNARQLIALAGTSPREYTSGTSINVKKRICKMGYAALRKTLFICSWTAIRNNPACKEQYERLKAAGKPSKVALIAVGNKLLRQAFAIATNRTTYQYSYSPSLSRSIP